MKDLAVMNQDQDQKAQALVQDLKNRILVLAVKVVLHRDLVVKDVIRKNQMLQGHVFITNVLIT
ncbi:hypothetical protein D3C83_128340 [compost metagenome]